MNRENLFREELEKSWAQLAGIREIESKASFLSQEELFSLCLDRAIFLLRIEKGFWLHKDEEGWKIAALKGIEEREAKEIIKKIKIEDGNTIRVSGLMSIPLVWEDEVIERANFIKEGDFTYMDEKRVLPLLKTALFVIKAMCLQKEIRQLSTSVGHRIGTKMVALENRVLTASQLITTSEDRLQKEIDSMDRIIQNTRAILNDFAGLLKPLSLNIQEIDIATLIEEVIEEMGIAPYCKKSLERPIIQGDKQRLKEVFSELINNSKAFLPQKGGEINLILQAKGDNIEITIADNGPGIPFENKRKIFEPFFTTGKGTGLGLCIVKRFIEAHKGKIREEGIPGEGARFVIALPKGGK
ncbi:MAG: HAMP domain-containing sensor histidine kinase [bacterium]